jgi:hypothetical protein
VSGFTWNREMTNRDRLWGMSNRPSVFDLRQRRVRTIWNLDWCLPMRQGPNSVFVVSQITGG